MAACGCLRHLPTNTSLPFTACTGRAFILYSFLNAASCAGEIDTGVFITTYRTSSLQGGVVREPMNV